MPAPPQPDRNPPGPLRIAAMISGGGRTLVNLVECIQRRELMAEVVRVISSRSEVAGVERAQQLGLDVKIAGRLDFEAESARDDAISRWLEEAKPDLICLCGYLRHLRLDPWMLGKVINIHPALLPDFGGKGMHGRHVHSAVLAAGRCESGCTVHFVDDQYDHGPKILQRTCPVLPDDTPESLAARVFEQECIAYPEAIRMIQQGRVRWDDGQVRFTGNQ